MNTAHQSAFLQKYWLLGLLIIVKLIVQFALVDPIYELHRDEFLHLDQAFHPAAGYISVPPFSSWMASLIYLMGGGIFWVRLVPALFGVGTILFAWLMVEELGGKIFAKILTAVLLIFSVYTRLNVLFQPNSFDILTWTILFYCWIKYIKNEQGKWLYLMSIITALGLYNKYTLVFLLIGFLIGLLFTKHRQVFKRKDFYYAVTLCLVLFLPNIIWQIAHHFPVVYHMRALKESQLVNISRMDFLIDQVKYGVIGIPTLLAIWAFISYTPFRVYRFIVWTCFIVLFLFTMNHAKSYYSLGLYPVLFAFGSVYMEVLFKKWRSVLMSFFIVTNIIAFFLIVQYLMPFQKPSEIIDHQEAYERIGLLRWEDGINRSLPQDFADMLGWKEMADKALAAYQTLPANEVQNTIIICDNYGQAGALNYYNRKKTKVAYSLQSDYIYWIPNNIDIKNMILVGDIPPEEVIGMFASYTLVGTVENEFARENGTGIYLMLGANSETSELFYKMIEERKKDFDIF